MISFERLENMINKLEFTKDFFYRNKGKIIVNSIFIIIFIGIIVFVFNDYYLYDSTIAKVVRINDTYIKSVDGPNGEVEIQYNQEIIAKIKNGDHKGEEIILNNKYSTSKISSDKYSKGDDLFVTISNKTQDEDIRGNITGVKRDKYVAILFSIFFILIIIVANLKGMFILISLIINIVVFSYSLHLYSKGIDILVLSNIMVLFFTVVSMILTTGFNKKAFSAILSTLFSVLVIKVLFNVVVAKSGSIDYSALDYIVNPDDVHKLFMTEIMIGGLGAIMDVSISMSTAINELVEKDNNISVKSLISSGREIGYDIMGTMINVLLFTYICGSIPTIILKIKNGFNLISLITLRMPFEIYRFLIGSIGIVLTIPIAILISITLLKKGKFKV